MPEPSTAFFSYSRDDSEFALRLAQDLKSAGANVWIDQLDIDPGQEWDNAIEEAVTQSPRMLLILSPASVKSRNVRNEISFALDAQKVIIPVLYRDCTVPLQLHRVQHIDFRTDYDRGLQSLLKALRATQSAAVSASTGNIEVAQPIPSEVGRDHGAAKPGELEAGAKPPQPPLKTPERQPTTAAITNTRLSKSAWIKTGVAGIAVVVIASGLYWSISRNGRRAPETQNPTTQASQSQPPSAQSDNAASGNRQTSAPLHGIAATGSPGAKANSAGSYPTEKRRYVSAPLQAGPSLDNGPGDSNANAAQPSAAGTADSCNLPSSWGPVEAGRCQAALNGDVMTMMHFGGRYHDDKDYAKALFWYHKAAAAGDTSGMTNIGKMYENGEGVARDYSQAAAWYRMAADRKDRDGMYYLGTLYEKGLGVPWDLREAIVLYQKSAALGLGDAQSALDRLGVSH